MRYLLEKHIWDFISSISIELDTASEIGKCPPDRKYPFFANLEWISKKFESGMQSPSENTK